MAEKTDLAGEYRPRILDLPSNLASVDAIHLEHGSEGIRDALFHREGDIGGSRLGHSFLPPRHLASPDGVGLECVSQLGDGLPGDADFGGREAARPFEGGRRRYGCFLRYHRFFRCYCHSAPR